MEGKGIRLGREAINDGVEGLHAERLESWRHLTNVIQEPLACHDDSQFVKSLGSYNKLQVEM